MEKPAPGNVDASPDRISRLPEPVLQHILTFFDQKSAIRTCVLSKSWRDLWCTRPKLEFLDEYTASPKKKLAFLSVVDRALQAYHDRKLRLRELTLMSDGAGDAASLLNKWIPVVVHNMQLNKLDLYVYSVEPGMFELPSVVFESQSLRNITLRGCQVKSTPPRVCLERLQKLRLSGVYILDEVLDNILSNCPSVEYVSLSDCRGFARIKRLGNSKPTSLKSFYFVDNRTDGNVSIGMGDEFENLRTVEISNCFLSFNGDGPLLNAYHLTRLRLERVWFLSGSFSCDLPCLEELRLEQCFGVKEFKLVSRSMKRLTIKEPERQFEANIDAPSIVSFIYEGIAPQFIYFARTTSNDWKSNIILTYPFNELKGMLKALSQSEISLQLDPSRIYSLQNEEVPVVVEHLTIERSYWLYSERSSADAIKRLWNYSEPSSANFFNKLFRMFRPSFIYMDLLTASKNEHHQFAEFLLAERKMAQCHFWQLALEGVNLQVCYPDQKEWLSVESTRFPELGKKGAVRRLRLQLKWRQ